MSTCLRVKPNNQGTVAYKRHKYKDGQCKFCGVSQVEQLRSLANRRARRKADRQAFLNPMVYV